MATQRSSVLDFPQAKIHLGFGNNKSRGFCSNRPLVSSLDNLPDQRLFHIGKSSISLLQFKKFWIFQFHESLERPIYINFGISR